jgi:hypothetical protein
MLNPNKHELLLHHNIPDNDHYDVLFNAFLDEINHSIPGSCGSSALARHQLLKRDQQRLGETSISSTDVLHSVHLGKKLSHPTQ